MTVYNIQQLKSVSLRETEDKQAVTLAPVFTTTLKAHGLHPPLATFSRPHIDNVMIRVTVTMKQGIYGLIVPRNGDPPRVTMISNDKIFGVHICLGINRLFSQSGMMTWAASCTWPDDNAIGLNGELRQTLPLRRLGLEVRRKRVNKHSHIFCHPPHLTTVLFIYSSAHHFPRKHLVKCQLYVHCHHCGLGRIVMNLV